MDKTVTFNLNWDMKRMSEKAQECNCHVNTNGVTQVRLDPEAEKTLDCSAQVLLDPEVKLLPDAVCCQCYPTEAGTQKDLVIQEVGSVTLDIARLLQQKIVFQSGKDPSSRDIYIDACQKLEDVSKLLKSMGHAPKHVSWPDTVQTSLTDCIHHRCAAKEENTLESLESTDSKPDKYISLSKKLSTALLLRLLPKLTKKGNNIYLGQTNTIWRRLAPLVLAKVKAADRNFMTVEDNIDDITNAMIQDLLRIFVTPENLLRAAMASDDPIFDQAVVNFLTREINARKKKGRIARFFSGIKKFFCCGS